MLPLRRLDRLRVARSTTPFGALRWAVPPALCWLAAATVAAVAPVPLPGGRWLAVHLFTVGVVTNLIVALSHHFAQTLAHAPERGAAGARLVLVNVSAVGLVAGLPSGARGLFAAGAAGLLAAVLWLYADVRRLRRRSLGGRFAFVLRNYERACGAFVHGALLGVGMGAGWLAGEWYGGARLAHLHTNVLGWGGLTLLATLVFFGPTLLRARMEPRADRAAASGLRWGAAGLSVAVVALLVTGAGGPVGTLARAVAAIGLALYAWGATRVCLPVLRASLRAVPSAHARLVQCAVVWFPLVAWADAGAVAFAVPALFDALGVLMLVGVLGQAILAALSYLFPLLPAADGDARERSRARLARLPRTRVVALNAGALLLAVAASGWAVPAVVAQLGGALVAAAVAFHLALFAASAAVDSLPTRPRWLGGAGPGHNLRRSHRRQGA